MAPRPSFKSAWTQFFPPKPGFTEKDIGDLKGRVYIVTGSNTGLGKDIARMLYGANAKVYMAARSEQKGRKAIEDIRQSAPASTGVLEFLHLDLNDLEQTKAAAQEFLSKEQKLHVLFNNAGVFVTPTDPPPKTVQGQELCLGVNCIAPFLFTKLLTPTLISTAKAEPAGTVRVVWVSSFGLELNAHEGVGISTDNLDYHIPKPSAERYGLSKSGVWALAVEYARRYKDDGVVSVAINPGNLLTELDRDQGTMLKLVVKLLCYPVVNGACTAIFAALSPGVPERMNSSEDWGEHTQCTC